ncbi:MAG: c-type cytochrome biogenesis protein CcmI [Gammaproteobacteria bacterium]|nr:c-type cytochrome biogenesis protein CcmI [Gammaproteobacteria bacterium]NIN62405.1 c-type cytochrome biogenesis protein CcmI [Gammaproteobacteria bacterium]NIO61459.1 c-type cytochrome biogenesis protein CcmI [Gammaproteobacteria bacterium]NIP49827.1 c-type cytochrome biogenesis protein CcmI [Gammaproteobacteria bacterium]NIQ11860.1 c-type cytochrome biogenesis protein CcmI [Gammaproteobacteria bacterium]
MWLFWFVAGCMTLFALIIIIRALRHHPSWSAETEQKATVRLYQTRLEEIDRDIENGTLPRESSESLRKEIENELLQAVDKQSSISQPAAQPVSRSLVISLCLLVPILSVALYLNLGEPRLIVQSIPAEAPLDTALPPIDEMVTQLESRLSRQPDDAEGWLMLTRTYLVLGEGDKALQAAEKLYSLTADEPETLLIYIQSLVLSNGGQFNSRTDQLIEQLLTIDPDNKAGQWLAGLAAEQRGDYQSALTIWEQLLPTMTDDPEATQSIEGLIARVREKMKPGPDQVTVDETGGETPTAISVRVDVTPALAPVISAQDTLFIYARASEGPAMPLAIVRKQAGDLPLVVTLDDSMAMSPAMKLSSFTTVDILARISKSGAAARQSGDLVGEVKQLTVNQQEDPVSLTISTVVP